MPEISRSSMVMYAAFALVVVVLGVRFIEREAPEPEAPPTSGASTSAAGARASTGASVEIGRPRADGTTVHVSGAVRRPGVYRLTAGARVQDAVRRAGGARPGADVNAINLAAKVADGQQVVVPVRAPRGAANVAG